MAPRNLELYVRAAKTAGCHPDQVRRFLKLGIILQPQQLVASARARECDDAGGPTRVGYGGARGGGKSHWSLSQLAEDCELFPGLKCLLLRKVGKSGQESFEDLSRVVLRSVPHDYSAARGIVTFPNGSRIILGHYKDERDVDKYLGLEYDVIAIEESTTLTEAKHRMIRTCLRTSKQWRPRIYETTNPGGLSHVRFRKLFVGPWRRKEEADTRFVPATYLDNRFLNEGYVDTLNDLPGWQRKAWRDGDWDVMAGQFFSNWRDSIHVIQPFRIPMSEPDKDGKRFPLWTVWGALDYGFTHYTVFYLIAKDGDGNLYILAEHAIRKKLPSWHAPAIKSLLARWGLTVKDLRTIVAGADVFAKKGDQFGLTIAEQYDELGIHLEPANDDRINGAGEILKRLGDEDENIPSRLFVFDADPKNGFGGCPRLIECLPAMMHDPHRPEDVLKVDCDAETGVGGDDPYDALRYGVMADATGIVFPKVTLY